MNRLAKKLCLSLILIVPFCSSFAQPNNFDILINRDSIVGNLVYATISLNGQVIGAAFENNDLKIPAGKYQGLIRYNSGHNFVQSKLGKMSRQGDFLIEVSNVPGNQIPTLRTDILLHPGNLPKHSKGCILLGPSKKVPGNDAEIGPNHPLRKLRLAFYGTDQPNASPNKNITVTIKELK